MAFPKSFSVKTFLTLTAIVIVGVFSWELARTQSSSPKWPTLAEYSDPVARMDSVQRSSDSLFHSWTQSLAGRFGWEDPKTWMDSLPYPMIAQWPSPSLSSRFSLPPATGTMATEPRIEDAGDRLIIEVEVPGLDDGSLEINVQKDRVELSGSIKHVQEQRDAAGRITSRSVSSSAYSSNFSLPAPVEPEGLISEYRSNILHIEIPKIYKDI